MISINGVVQLACFLSLELVHSFFMLRKTRIFMTSFQDPIGLTLMNLCMRALFETRIFAKSPLNTFM